MSTTRTAGASRRRSLARFGRSPHSQTRPAPIAAALGAVLALLAGLLTLAIPSTSAATVTPSAPPGAPIATAAATGNVTVDPTFAAGQAAGADVTAVARQSDGKTVAAGWFTTAVGTGHFGMRRIQRDGITDPTFAPELRFDDTVNAIAVQADGRILVGGYFTTVNAVSRPGIARLNPDGTLDPTFNPGPGFSNSSGEMAVHAIAVTSSGQLLVGGAFDAYRGVERRSLVRLSSGGELDGTFNAMITGTAGPVSVHALALQPDGKILVGGLFSSVSLNMRNNFARLHGNGGLDATLTGGWGFNHEVLDVAVEGDGHLVIAGAFDRFNTQASGGIVRLRADGYRDNGFTVSLAKDGARARVTSLIERTGWALGAVGDFTTCGGEAASGIAGFTSNGAGTEIFCSPASFPGAKVAPTTVAGRTAGPVAVGEDFPAVIVGGLTTMTGVNLPYALARLSFNPGTSYPDYRPLLPTHRGFDGPVSAMLEQPDGKVLVAGAFRHYNGRPVVGLARVNANGTLDQSFQAASVTGLATRLALLPDGRIAVVWEPAPGAPSRNQTVTRLLPDGAADPTFTSTQHYSEWRDRGITSLVRQPDGKLLIGGHFSLPGQTPIPQLARLNADGGVDGAFAPVFFAPFDRAKVDAITMQPDGRIVVVGWFEQAGAVAAQGIARVELNGTPDGSFATGSGFGPMWQQARDVVQQPDGKIIVVGDFATFNGTPRSAIVRLQATGALDPTFNPGSGFEGKWNAQVFSVALQPDGRILAAGAFTSYAGVARQGFVRLLSDGTIDHEFDPGGGLAQWPETGMGRGRAPMLAQAGGAILLGGDYFGFNGADPSPANITRLTWSPPPPPTPSTLVAIPPARTVDTRVSSGGAGPLAPGETRTLAVTTPIGGGAPVVPAGAVAVAYNVTVPGSAGAGHVRVMPGDASGLTGASAINFRPAETIANAAVVKISPDRSIKVHNGAGVPVDVIIDVSGYFVAQVDGAAVAGAAGARAVVPANGAGGLFTAVTPVRVYDTAADPAGMLPADASRLVSTAVTQDGSTAVVPAGASAVVYNITVTDTAGAGHLRVMPGDVASTPASAINWTVAGERIANGAVVQVDAQRRIRVFNGGGAPVRFFVDVTGYYSATGREFYPIDPVRTTETRYLFGGAGPIAPLAAGQRSVSMATSHVGGYAVLPVGATAAAYNATVVGTGSPGHLRVYPTGAPLVGASALNWPGAGYTRANASIVAVSPNREVTLYNGASTPTDVLIDINGYYE